MTDLGEKPIALASEWRRLGRAALIIALLTSPAAFDWFHRHNGWGIGLSLLATFGTVIVFRGLADLVLRRLIPWPSLFGTDDQRLKEDDIVSRRRTWFWRKRLRLAVQAAGFITALFLYRIEVKHEQVTWLGTASDALGRVGHLLSTPQLWVQFVFVLFLFLANFLIFMGPLMLMGISQIRGYEPGDADWGVRLEDVRGQAEAKEEARRVVSLWQSGEAFEQAGGKRERGLLFLGAPGTGKTMLAKAIATGFNSPFVSIPGSGFAQTFIGIDALIVRWLARKAKRLAAKWGGQCIVFIDEIDAVGMRRSALGGGTGTMMPSSFHDICFFGPSGALTPSGDLILETRAWRERLFAQREPPRPLPYPPLAARLSGIVNQVFPGMMGGGMGQLALNQLLVTMDGIDNPPFWARFRASRINSLLDACYLVPRRVGRLSLRLPSPRPSRSQIYFIGATNVPMEVLDPALTRPGRLGRHIWFRTPTKHDRLDIFDLYLGKVAHEPELDLPERRDELARITNGYSPAMIDQVCSMALTYAQHALRQRFGWTDILEAMTTIESGTAIGIQYIPEETRAVAIHEAGHAVAAHVYMKGTESTRLSIRKRGASLGHHVALEKEERFSSWQSEEMGRLIWTLGAMAAERVFYGESSTGVGGDVQSATARAAWMVGGSGMAPELDAHGIRRRFERIGIRIMNRTAGGGPFSHDPIASVLADRDKRAHVAQFLGQAYVHAHSLISHNRKAVEQIAEAVVERGEIYGNELIALLDAADLRPPDIDLAREQVWPIL